jgi:peptidyl-prolyl cis-trans isomerase A (cyclophilin A)
MYPVNHHVDDDPHQDRDAEVFVTSCSGGAPNSRTTKMFINYRDNSNLDGMGFAPFGEVVAGMDVLDALHTGYGEGAPRGRGPDQGKVQALGNAYLKADFPKLDYILKASIVD